MLRVLLPALSAAAAAWCYLQAVDARREVHRDEPVDVTPSLRAAARNGHLAALFATAAVLTGPRIPLRWYVVLAVFLLARVIVEVMLGRATRKRG